MMDEATMLDNFHKALGSSGSSPPSFYAVSKWLGEKVVWRAKEDGLPVMVVRPGMITGNSFTGASKVQRNLVTKFEQMITLPYFCVEFLLWEFSFLQKIQWNSIL